LLGLQKQQRYYQRLKHRLMSFNKIYLRELKEVKKEYSEDPEGFKRRMSKADALIGPTGSMKFIEKIMKQK